MISVSGLVAKMSTPLAKGHFDRGTSVFSRSATLHILRNSPLANLYRSYYIYGLNLIMLYDQVI